MRAGSSSIGEASVSACFFCFTSVLVVKIAGATADTAPIPIPLRNIGEPSAVVDRPVATTCQRCQPPALPKCTPHPRTQFIWSRPSANTL